MGEGGLGGRNLCCSQINFEKMAIENEGSKSKSKLIFALCKNKFALDFMDHFVTFICYIQEFITKCPKFRLYMELSYNI